MYRYYTEFRTMLERALDDDFVEFQFTEENNEFTVFLKTVKGIVQMFSVEDEEETDHLADMPKRIWNHVYQLYEHLKDYSDFSIDKMKISDVDNQVQIEIIPCISPIKQKFEIKGKPFTITTSMVEGVLQHKLNWHSWRREDRFYTVFCSIGEQENFVELGTVANSTFIHSDIRRKELYTYYIVETNSDGKETLRSSHGRTKS